MPIHGEFVKFDAIPTRKVVRVVVEVPIEKANETLHALGGFPDAANAKSVAVALMNCPPENTLKGGKLAQMAGILCGEGGFITFCRERYGEEDPVLAIYKKCGVTSRAHLDHDEDSAKAFNAMRREYEQWIGFSA